VRLGLVAQVPVRRQPSGQALRRQALVGQEAQEVRQGRPQARDGLAAQPALPQQESAIGISRSSTPGTARSNWRGAWRIFWPCAR
jgi:hypothetical protein